MKKNFVMLNFCTEYSSEGSTHKRMDRDACFGPVFHSKGILNNKYHIKIYKLGDFLNKKNQNNACLTDKKGIINHLRILKSLFKFNYKLKEERDYFMLTLSLNADVMYHKYLLCWVRYLYEYPFNVFLSDTNKLKKLPDFKFESVINLFNLVGATSCITDHGTQIHAIGETHLFKKLLTTYEIIKSIDKEIAEDRKWINEVFPVVRDKEFLTLDEDDDSNLHCLEYWESEKEFNDRLKVYKHNYKILKNNKKK